VRLRNWLRLRPPDPQIEEPTGYREEKVVTRSTKTLFRAAALMAMLCAPMTLAVNAGTGSIIEAPAQPQKGLGLVLLVSLQRG